VRQVGYLPELYEDARPEEHKKILMGLNYFQPNPLSYVYPNYSQIQSLLTYLPMKMEHTECSETSAYKIQTPGNYPEENIQHKKF
jgi:hypothetical protein